ncbi:Ger(x)C family spore germination protein [Paenibacillus kobensis]|uniref:Ger(x)C family spore germination protein n=1 Tax=Paenibacillus kobensis TaxID=59841 RepID=UPI000FDC8C83|nr:Ger(x)C family spore germination protein [Paenibacillus kobensis]
MRIRSRRRIAFLFVASSIALSGCWDRVEIDQRGFIVGVGVDAVIQEVDESSAEEESGSTPSGEQTNSASNKKQNKKAKYKVTYQVVTPSGMKAENANAQPTAAYFHLTVEGTTFSTMEANLAQRMSRAPFFEHLKVLIFSEAVARRPGDFAEAIDYFLRDSQMRRSTKVMVTPNKASEILSTQPPGERLPSAYLELVSSNGANSSRILPHTRIGEVQESLLKNKSFGIQTVSNGSRTYSTLNGTAVFSGRSNRLIGFLDGRETAGLNFLRDSIKGGHIEFPYGDEGRGVFIVQRMTRRMRVSFGKDGLPAFDYHIEVQGSLNEAYQIPDTLSEKTLYRMDEYVGQSIKQLIESAIVKLQKQYRCDVIELADYMSRKHHRWWSKHRGQWERGDDLFSQVPIHVQVKAHIHRTGNINISEE